ncbi:NRDE family protein, partial [bacterium]|nr:NRDE family protein [bacterium]
LQARASLYNPFNLLLFDGAALLGFESHSGRTLLLAPGIGAVSNAGFNTPWPKLQRLSQSLHAHASLPEPEPEQLLGLLEHRAPAPDADLPATGVPLALERALSP